MLHEGLIGIQAAFGLPRSTISQCLCKHSGFYSTTLDLLLEHLTATNLILTGIAGNNCVLFTANDAYMRDFKLFIPSDCVVSLTEEENRYALMQMEKVLKANINASTELDLKAIRSDSSGYSEKN